LPRPLEFFAAVEASMRCFIYRLTYAVVKVLLNTTKINLTIDPAGVQRLFNHGYHINLF
jgi:hypothetical protein